MNTKTLEPIGYCKECGHSVYESDAMKPDHPDLYECSYCSHPHTKEELILID